MKNFWAGAALALTLTGSAVAQDKVVNVGVLTDMSGPYADVGGAGSVVAAQMAIDDSGLLAQGWTINLVSADHQNKVDIGSNIARQWIDEGKADVILDSLNSGVALAVSQIVREKNKVFLVSGAGSSDLTGKACSPNTIHWTYDTFSQANGTGKALLKAGGDSWFFITADYAFGKALERDTTAVVLAHGGKVLGDAMAPLNSADFSSQLLQAQASKAKVIGLANAGADTANAIKQASEFGVTQGGQKLAALLMFISDVHALGLQAAQGLDFTTAYYWDLNDRTRDFGNRFARLAKNGAKPTMVQAGVYSSLIHYLKAVEALGRTPDGAAIVRKMEAMPTEDEALGKGYIRPGGRKIHPLYLLQVKTPAESKYPWDYAKVALTLPGDEAFRPLAQSQCPLVKK
ncbi:ABC transporter substrate-binding protein [Rhodoblastus sp.]|uniref:ABC transporter substrate-binding protein n=1 Tax=Rhodoblastus sp. TaxID=1962975 RepID=UPI003F970AC1